MCIRGTSPYRGQRGFTLIELMITLAIIGILMAISVPLATSYRTKAEFISLKITLRYLMDGQETYFVEHDSFYPNGNSTLTINEGEEKDIPELKYVFPAGHKHKFVFSTYNYAKGGQKINYYWIYAYVDFDYNGNGINDLYFVRTLLVDNEPVLESEGKPIYRQLLQFQ